MALAVSFRVAAAGIRSLGFASQRIAGASLRSSERSVTVGEPDRAAELIAGFFTRLEGGGVGGFNPIYAEINRRQFTRDAPGGVGAYDPVYAEINRQLFTRTESGGVGGFNAVYAEIARRQTTRLDLTANAIDVVRNLTRRA